MVLIYISIMNSDIEPFYVFAGHWYMLRKVHLETLSIFKLVILHFSELLGSLHTLDLDSPPDKYLAWLGFVLQVKAFSLMQSCFPIFAFISSASGDLSRKT